MEHGETTAAAGISLKPGLTYPGMNDICVTRAMIESADEVFLVDVEWLKTYNIYFILAE